MKSTSSIRRIDDLGRIVIPKEIRESLKLLTGSSVDVKQKGKEVVITKHSGVKNIASIAKMCVDCFEDFGSIYVFVCDMNEIIASNKKCRELKKNIPVDLYKCLQNGTIIILQDASTIKFGETKFASQAIFPISIFSEPSGGLVVMSKSYMQNFDFAKTIHKFLINYLNLT